jgi:hypothetical protein
MKLGEKQELFMRMIPLLIQYAHFLGYEVRGGDLYRHITCSHGHPESAHRSKLAIDLNLFKDGEYIVDGTGHRELHDLWDLLGGAERIREDLNHYSLEHEGVR